MPYTVNENREYEKPVNAVYQAALGAVAGLEGKLHAEDKDARQLVIKFDKKILGKVLGDRTNFTVNVADRGAEGSSVSVEGFPVDAVGRKLMFGARKGVAETVMSWFFAHLEHRLK